MIIFILIFLCLFLILILIIDDKNKQIKEFESIFDYYQWHDAIYIQPENNCWYLVQTEDKDKMMKVLFYDINQKQWKENKSSDIYNEYVIAWCHLPNYRYHK